MPRGRPLLSREPSGEDIPEEDDILTVSLELKSGRFSSRISVPLFADDEAKKAFIESWMQMMEAGLRCSPRRKDKAGG